MSIDKKTVTKVAKLARIRLSEQEVEKASNQLTRIFDWIEQLESVNTDDVTEMTGVGDYTLRMRRDIVRDGGIKDAVLENAPEKAFDCYVVPKVIE